VVEVSEHGNESSVTMKGGRFLETLSDLSTSEDEISSMELVVNITIIQFNPCIIADLYKIEELK
jgi:hypothetical protein